MSAQKIQSPSHHSNQITHEVRSKYEPLNPTNMLNSNTQSIIKLKEPNAKPKRTNTCGISFKNVHQITPKDNTKD